MAVNCACREGELFVLRGTLIYKHEIEICASKLIMIWAAHAHIAIRQTYCSCHVRHIPVQGDVEFRLLLVDLALLLLL